MRWFLSYGEDWSWLLSILLIWQLEAFVIQFLNPPDGMSIVSVDLVALTKSPTKNLAIEIALYYTN